jgi:hypothetical protein
MRRAYVGCAALFAVSAAGTLWAQPEPDSELRIIVLEGEGAINNIREHTAHAPVIRVLDAEERPVVGATVNFLLPDLGASGYFPEGRTNFTTRTDTDGQAVARGLRPNNVAGRFQIRVSAASGSHRGTATITQVNVAPAAARGKSKTKYVIAVLVAGGAAAGAVFAAKGSGNGSSTSTPGGTTITPGSPVFGPPR